MDGAPEVLLHALDPDEDFVHVPLVPWPRPMAAQAVGETRTEFLAPASHRLVGDDNAATSQEQLNIPQAGAEHVVQRDSVADDLGGEPVAVVGIGCGFTPPVSPASAETARRGYRDNAHRVPPVP